METNIDPKEEVECEIHGTAPSMRLTISGKERCRFCFVCWADKQAEGLKNYLDEKQV